MQIDLGQSTLILLGLICVLPLLIFVVLAFLVYRRGAQWLESWFEPNPEMLHRRMETLRQNHPNATTEQLVSKIIHRQALRAGVVGAVTGIGGFWTLPIGLPVDLALSYQIQSTLVSFIAYLYGDTRTDSLEAQVRAYLVMTGSSKATQTTTNFLMRVAGKSFSKVIPLVGAAISFATNYLIVQLMGRAAARWYTQRAASTNPSSDAPIV
jgi:uncharacterized protein (DUF697 family)